MSLIRKMLWPSAIALSLLVLMTAMGQGVKTASAHPEVIGICGPEIITEDETALYVAVFEDYDGPTIVSLDDSGGDSDITSGTVIKPGGGEGATYEELDDPVDFHDFIMAVEFDSGDEWDDLLEDLEDIFDFDLGDCFAQIFDEEDLEEDLHDDIKEKILDGDITCGEDDECIINDEIIDAIVQALLDAIFDGETDCDDLGEIAAFAAIDTDEGVTPGLAQSIHDAIEDQCNNDELPGLTLASIAVVDVTCEEAGDFDLTFAAAVVPFEGKAGAIDVTCVGEVDEGLITCTPCKVETSPAIGSVSYSLIAVSLLDENGDPADQDDADMEDLFVTFNTDLCVFNDEDGLNDEELLTEALEIFGDYDVNDPESADAITDWFEDTYDPDDPDDDSNDVPVFTLDDDFGDFDEDDTVAGIILDCSSEDVKPGVTEVCFSVDIEDQDVEGCVKVTVVGPPAKVTAAAAPASLICGEKATISIEVLDAANQPVSDHTRVEAVTNLGGVLAGTGAVAGQAGLVTPVSSTVGETFNGKSTMYLLTSDAHTGPYEVVVATGGQGSVNTGLGGVFSTPPQVTQVTVSCTQPVTAAPVTQPAPTVTAPRTGTGVVSPPNTGDAGLADSSSSFSWALVAVAGVMAFSVAGLATLKISRR